MENWESDLRRLEEAVTKSDGDGVRARWESGRYMVTLREGRKQLPPGVRAKWADALKVRQSELTARMKFAAKFPTEEELTNVISKFKTWFEIKQQALTDNPRKQKVDDSGDEEQDEQDEQDEEQDDAQQEDSARIRHARRVLETVVSADRSVEDLAELDQIDELVARLRPSAAVLREVGVMATV